MTREFHQAVNSSSHILQQGYSIYIGEKIEKHASFLTFLETSSEDATTFLKDYNQGCANPGKSHGSRPGSFLKIFYGSGSGSETDPTNFKKLLWDLIKSKYFEGQILQ